MDQDNEAQKTAKVVIPKTAKEYVEWFENRHFATTKQWVLAKNVYLSFDALAMNKNNPAALEAAQRMHDADMAKLEAMLEVAK